MGVVQLLKWRWCRCCHSSAVGRRTSGCSAIKGGWGRGGELEAAVVWAVGLMVGCNTHTHKHTAFVKRWTGKYPDKGRVRQIP